MGFRLVCFMSVETEVLGHIGLQLVKNGGGGEDQTCYLWIYKGQEESTS